jgi:hypothetical protein
MSFINFKVLRFVEKEKRLRLNNVADGQKYTQGGRFGFAWCRCFGSSVRWLMSR